MHGTVHTALKKYVETEFDSLLWEAMLEHADLAEALYLAVGNYPDEEAVALISALAELTDKTVAETLENFGVFLSAELITMYHALIRPEWGARELLLNTEEAMHKVVRLKNPGSEPPKLVIEPIDDKTLRFVYRSKRKMHDLARGIIRGIARYYGEPLSIKEREYGIGGVEMHIRLGS